jgi:hypothetical protein
LIVALRKSFGVRWLFRIGVFADYIRFGRLDAPAQSVERAA